MLFYREYGASPVASFPDSRKKRLTGFNHWDIKNPPYGIYHTEDLLFYGSHTAALMVFYPVLFKSIAFLNHGD